MRESDFQTLDIVAANMRLRDLDVPLSRMKNSLFCLKTVLMAVNGDCDSIV